MLLLAGVFLSLLSSINGLYTSSSEVVSLTASNFDRLVIQSDAIWVVEFYAPWCRHCKALAPEYAKAAAASKGIIKVGAVNFEEEKSLVSRFKIEGFPTIKIFGGDKKKPTNFGGLRSAKGILDSALEAAKQKIYLNLSGMKDVVILTDENYDFFIYNSKDYWLVEFFSPRCGYCQKLEPEYAEAAKQLKGKAKLGAIDATIHGVTTGKYNIQGYPTIYWFEPGAKGKEDAKPYDGGRTSSEIVSWVLDRIVESIPSPEVVQLLNEETLKKQCSNSQLCIIAVLPHIFDCQSSCRNNYISILTKVAEKYKKKLWGWIWIEANAQCDLEEILNIGGFGYPALAALNYKKMKFSILRGSFSEEGITEFLRDLSFGRGQILDVKDGKLPNIERTEPWNGTDIALPEEEDIDLSDVVLEDIKDEL